MSDDQKLTLWIGAFRYYLGRMTYAVCDFCDLLSTEWPNLPERARTLIRKELDEAIQRDNEDRELGRQYCRLGMDMDRQTWLKLRETLG